MDYFYKSSCKKLKSIKQTKIKRFYSISFLKDAAAKQKFHLSFIKIANVRTILIQANP